jgi:hypothetical protein
MKKELIDSTAVFNRCWLIKKLDKLLSLTLKLRLPAVIPRCWQRLPGSLLDWFLSCPTT